MGRLEIIDGFRGYFLVFMMLNHLVFAGGYWLVKVNHNQVAFVEDAQGFIFLSGFLVGLIYVRKMQKAGFSAGAGAIWRRARDLYVYVLMVLATILAATLFLPGAQEIWRNWIGDLAIDNPVRLVSAALMLYQPTYMDILPQYIFYMIFAPFAVWWTLKGRGQWVLLISVLLWVVAQLGLYRPLVEPVDAWLKGDGELGIRNHFNLFGWQIIFFPAIVLGVLTAQNKIEWERIFTPSRTLIPIAALAFCLLFLPLRVATAYGFMPESIFEQFRPFEIRGDFGLVYLINFAAAASGMAWLVIAGPRHGSAVVRAMAGAVHWVMTLPFLRLLGRHSLQVYAWHVILVYGVLYFDQRTPDLSEAAKTGVAIGAILLLSLPPLWRERDNWLGGTSGPKPAG